MKSVVSTWLVLSVMLLSCIRGKQGETDAGAGKISPVALHVPQRIAQVEDDLDFALF